MSGSRPLADPKPVELEFKYDVSDEFIEAKIAQEGIKPAKRWAITISLSDDVEDPDTRRRIRGAHDVYLATDGYPELPEPTDDAATFIRAIAPWIREVQN